WWDGVPFGQSGIAPRPMPYIRPYAEIGPISGRERRFAGRGGVGGGGFRWAGGPHLGPPQRNRIPAPSPPPPPPPPSSTSPPTPPAATFPSAPDERGRPREGAGRTYRGDRRTGGRYAIARRGDTFERTSSRATVRGDTGERKCAGGTSRRSLRDTCCCAAR